LPGRCRPDNERAEQESLTGNSRSPSAQEIGHTPRLHAAAHVLAAVGGGGFLEHDAMENPLQSILAQPFGPLVDGRFALTDGAGLGVTPDLHSAKTFLVHHNEHRAK
jgi:hypothetical protein